MAWKLQVVHRVYGTDSLGAVTRTLVDYEHVGPSSYEAEYIDTENNTWRFYEVEGDWEHTLAWVLEFRQDEVDDDGNVIGSAPVSEREVGRSPAGQ